MTRRGRVADPPPRKTSKTAGAGHTGGLEMELNGRRAPRGEYASQPLAAITSAVMVIAFYAVAYSILHHATSVLRPATISIEAGR